MKQLTFKEYWESKEVLKQAVDATPIQEREYIITKYCKIPVYKDGSILEVALKPNQRINITWLYEDLNNPQAQQICFNDPNIEDRPYKSGVANTKLAKWVQRNTKE